MVGVSTLSPPNQKIRIKSLRAFHVRIPLRKPIVHASHSRTESENVVVACRLENGVIGFGEGVPREYVTGETIDTSLDLLHRASWDGLLEGLDEPRTALAALEAFELPRLSDDPRGCVGLAARCAAELAILDALGRTWGMSIREILLGHDRFSCLFEPRKHCFYSGVITSKPSLFREGVSALKMRVAGFRHVKIKVGTAGQDDPRRLELFRKLLRNSAIIRVDANEAWRPGEAVQRIRALEPFRVSAVEQPVRHEDLECLPAIRGQIQTPIMLDESLCSRWDALRAIKLGACDVFNIRLSKCGGLLPSLEIAKLAHDAGLSYQLGCQVGETGILSAAGRHFACLVRDPIATEGSYDRYLVRERLTRQDISFGYRGKAPMLNGPGLGVEVDSERLARSTVREVVLHG